MSLTKSLRDSKKINNIVYMTPTKLAIDIINLIDFKDGDRVLDPCKGKEHSPFYDNFPPNVEKFWCEIELGKNFYDFNEQVDWIIANPPFGKELNKWFEHSIELAKIGIVYILPTHSYTPKRMKIFEDGGFYVHRVHLVSCWFGYPCSVLILKRGVNSEPQLPQFNYKSPYKGTNNKELAS